MPTRTLVVSLRAAAAALTLTLGFSVAATASTLPIKVVQYNTNNGGDPSGQMDVMAAQAPDVVVTEEARDTQLSTYVNGMNSRMGTTAWHGVYARHCQAGTNPTCTSYTDESVMILTRLKTVSTTSRLIWARDDYHVARATIKMTVALADGTQVNVFVCHLPALSDASASRVAYVTTFQAWAQSFASPRLVGGDFNDSPGSTPIVDMTAQYYDAWALGGYGSGYTHSHDGVTLTSRIDYWFSDKGGTETLASVKTAGTLTNSDHLAVVAGYNISSKPTTTTTPPPTTETTLMSDVFSTWVAANWPTGVFTGTVDTTVPLAVNGGFAIGALKDSTTGVHYNGISTAAYDLTNSGAVSVQLTAAPNTATTAYAMFAVGSDGSNFYRWYESGNALVIEKKIAGAKTTLINLPYSPTTDQFLRIRRAANTATGTIDVIFETAPSVGGVPGTFTVRHSEAWDAHVVASAMRAELKAGTSGAVIAPGTVVWNNVKIATNAR